MRRQPSSHRADRAIRWFASRQFGVVARWQLVEKGVTAAQIRTRLVTGHLIEIHRGVYVVGHEAQHLHARKAAALLACHPNATLSHRTAADLWRILPYPAQGNIWITIPPEREATHAGIKVVRTALPPRDVTTHDDLPVTTPARTLLDIAAVVEADQLERAVAEAQFRWRTSEAQLRDQLEGNRRKRGTRALREVLGLPGGPRRIRSGGEGRMLRLLRAAKITGFEVNAKIHGYEVDFLWRELDFAVEVDGYDAHSGRIAFERDRLKIAKLNAKGITVMPVTGRRLKRNPDHVERDLREALARAAGMRST